MIGDDSIESLLDTLERYNNKIANVKFVLSWNEPNTDYKYTIRILNRSTLIKYKRVAINDNDLRNILLRAILIAESQMRLLTDNELKLYQFRNYQYVLIN